ncbi:MAG: hypothetical protein JXQ99_11455 [Hyphomicrobiaceae bacterium]
MNDEPKRICRTPTKDRDGVTRIPQWKFDTVRSAIISAVKEAGDTGLLFKDLPGAVKDRLSADHLAKLGSVGWHTTTVKLEMEVAGELERIAGRGPQRLRLAKPAL